MLQWKDWEKCPAGSAWAGELHGPGHVDNHTPVCARAGLPHTVALLPIAPHASETHIKCLWSSAHFPLCVKSNSKLQCLLWWFFSPYIALQGITLNILREDGDCFVEPGCQSDTVRFHSTSGWEYKHFLSDYQNWLVINIGATKSQFSRACK